MANVYKQCIKRRDCYTALGQVIYYERKVVGQHFEGLPDLSILVVFSS